MSKSARVKTVAKLPSVINPSGLHPFIPADAALGVAKEGGGRRGNGTSAASSPSVQKVSGANNQAAGSAGYFDGTLTDEWRRRQMIWKPMNNEATTRVVNLNNMPHPSQMEAELVGAYANQAARECINNSVFWNMIISRAKQVISTFEPRDTALVLNALTRVRRYDEELFELLVPVINDQLKFYSTVYLCMVLSAYSKAPGKSLLAPSSGRTGKSGTSSGGLLSGSFITNLVNEINNRLFEFNSPVELSMLVNSLSKLNIYNSAMFTRLSSHIQARMNAEYFSVRELSVLAYGFAKVYHTDHTLFNRIADKAVASLAEATPIELGRLILAYSKLNINNVPLFELVLTETANKLMLMSPAELVSTAYSFGQIKEVVAWDSANPVVGKASRRAMPAPHNSISMSSVAGGNSAVSKPSEEIGDTKTPNAEGFNPQVVAGVHTDNGSVKPVIPLKPLDNRSLDLESYEKLNKLYMDIFNRIMKSAVTSLALFSATEICSLLHTYARWHIHVSNFDLYYLIMRMSKANNISTDNKVDFCFSMGLITGADSKRSSATTVGSGRTTDGCSEDDNKKVDGGNRSDKGVTDKMVLDEMSRLLGKWEEGLLEVIRGSNMDMIKTCRLLQGLATCGYVSRQLPEAVREFVVWRYKSLDGYSASLLYSSFKQLGYDVNEDFMLVLADVLNTSKSTNSPSAHANSQPLPEFDG